MDQTFWFQWILQEVLLQVKRNFMACCVFRNIIAVIDVGGLFLRGKGLRFFSFFKSTSRIIYQKHPSYKTPQKQREIPSAIKQSRFWQLQYINMGLQNDTYSYIFKTATLSHCKTSQQFQRDFLSTLDTSCNLFISNIFALQSLMHQKIDLDHCFVPAHETFTNKQLPFLCPVINDQLVQGNGIQYKTQKLKFIIQYCVYLGLKRVALNYTPKESQEIFNSLKQSEKYFRKGRLTLMIIVPIGGSSVAEQQAIWESFINFRRSLNPQTTIELTIEINANLPERRLIKKWMGEHVSFLSIKQQAFITNNKGYPVLSNAHEQVVREFMRRHTNLILHHEQLSSTQQKQPYFKYLSFVLDKFVKSLTKRQLQAQGLIDYLQAPLQPYIDNLDGQVYDIFEFDSLKYSEYQLALIAALNSFKEDRVIVCYYVGSGKGLILTKLMSACKSTGKKIKVYCIEKNPYPLQTLKRRIQRGKWNKIVQIVETDIKDYVMPEHPDIIFSELLGGFGDNELSPECIKWAEKNATKETRIVPEKYTSFIRPISCHHIYKQLNKPQRQSYYTVNYGLAYSPFHTQPVWSFKHPIQANDNLQRKAVLEWKCTENMLIHGFEGSFDCNLFENAYFSIVPETLTKDFFSWFPLFFSFSEQEKVKEGETITVELQRKCSEQKIWYRWRYLLKTKENQPIKQSLWHNETGSTAIMLTE